MKQLTTKNGHNNPPNGSNGSPSTDDPVLSAGHQTAADEKALQPKQQRQHYDQAVILQQTSRWSRGIVWTIVGVTTFTVLWAAFGKIEQAVPAQGQLEPQGAVQDVQAPVGGVVEGILVEEGEEVSRGQTLIRFDPTAAQAQKESLEQIRDSLLQENAFYRSQMQGADSPEAAPPPNVPPQVLALTTNRAVLSEENRLYRAQLGLAPGENLTAEQAARLRAGQAEASTRAAAAQLEVAQLEQQLTQAENQLVVADETLAIDDRILSDIEPLVEEGALARIQFLRQQQESMRGESEVTRLRQEVSRLRLAIAQAEQRLSNTLALTSTDILTRIADNEKQIAEIDSQINKAIVENEKQIAEINSQLSQANLNLTYQELRAPIDGVVFDIQPNGPGFVANTSEPILKVVPSDALVAEVYVTNQDIGFISEGMTVDVRIDSFPFSEFGDIKGVVTHIGDDALPTDELFQFYRFPAKVELEEQTIMVNGREVPLQSGMSVSANIITRNRSILSIFTDRFAQGFDNFRNVR
jgi:HlyD family secretion protein